MAWNKLLQAIMRQRQQMEQPGMATPRMGMPQPGEEVYYQQGNGNGGTPVDFMPQQTEQIPPEVIEELQRRRLFEEMMRQKQDAYRQAQSSRY